MMVFFDKGKFNRVLHSKAEKEHPFSHGDAPCSPVFPAIIGHITYFASCDITLSGSVKNGRGHFKELDFSFNRVCAMHESR